MIPAARIEVRVVPGCTLYVRGGEAQRRRAMECAWAALRAGGLARGLAWSRAGTESKWTPMEQARAAPAWLDAGPCRRFEARADPAGEGATVEIVDLEPVLGEERASSIHVRVPEADAAAALAQVARWAVTELPLWWGTAGLFFVAREGPTGLAWDAIAAAAKRHWAVQVLDAPALQWDALAGLPSIGWLTMVGDALAETAGLGPERFAGAGERSVYLRRGRFGVACAAGSAPIRGDINRNEALEPYRAVNDMLSPLLLQSTRPWSGVFAKPELRQAWIGRFGQPEAWLTADVAPE
jgi:hypothetical protein